ncbi:MAG: DnaJ domain-containing protein [Pseudolabrys sp.]|nr:DnaJ domain-containing protein [Pseudolabrys sp.]
MLVFGLLALVLGLWALHLISKVEPKLGARILKAGGGIAALGLGVFLGLRGNLGMGIMVGAFGLGLLGWMPFGPAGFSARAQKSSGQASRVQSTFFEMELDHDTGAMRGRILSGRLQGAALEGVDIATLVELLGEVDDESRALLMAYLDRRDPGWSEYAQGDPAAGRGAAPGGKMSEQEAYQILGLQAGASADDIGRAHRTLMKKFHPDQGGSTYLAARINEAKEILLRRHR